MQKNIPIFAAFRKRYKKDKQHAWFIRHPHLNTLSVN